MAEEQLQYFSHWDAECSGEIGASILGNTSAKSSNCPKMSLMIYDGKENPLIFFISKSWAVHSYKRAYGSKMMVLRTQLDQAYDFIVCLFPCFSIVMHFCSHLIPCSLIVKWLQNRTSRCFWWSFALSLNSLLVAANEHRPQSKAESGSQTCILIEQFIFNVYQKKNIFVL